MTEIIAPERPQLRTIPGVELIKVGQWPASTGTWDVTAEDLAAAVRAAQSPSLSRPVIKLGHTDPRFDGEPAVGWVDAIRLSDDGSTLVGDLKGLPAWLADIMPSAYPNRSIEGAYNYTDQSGARHDFALTAVALLGVSPPAIGPLESLRDVAALYEVTASGNQQEGFWIMPKTINASTSVEDVRMNFYEQGPGKDTYWWIEELFLDPPEAIAMDDENGQLYRIPLTISEDSITWGEPQAVKREYVAASKKVAAASWTKNESRKNIKAAEAEEEDTDMELTTEQVTALTTALGLAADADAAAIVTAVEKLSKDTTSQDDEPAATIAARAEHLGMKLIDAAAWESTQKRIGEMVTRENTRLVDDAVRAGKLMPASRSRALEQMERGLLTTTDLDAMKPLVTMAGAEVGHNHNPDTRTSDDVRESEIYKNWK